MKFSKWLQSKKWRILFKVIFTIYLGILFLPFPLSLGTKIGILSLLWLPDVLDLGIEYYQTQNYFHHLRQELHFSMEEEEMMIHVPKAPTYELQKQSEYYQEYQEELYHTIEKMKQEDQEFQDYIHLWIHEIKQPLAALELMTINQHLEKEKVQLELEELSHSIEEVLYANKSLNYREDYQMKDYSLKEMVQKTIQEHRRRLQEIPFNLSLDSLDFTVYTDKKWICFILHQLLVNSIQYRKKEEPLNLQFWAEQKNNEIVLYMKDNAIGIKEFEQRDIWKKGFVGHNGRMIEHSTRMGLYISQQLANTLGIQLQLVHSDEDGSIFCLRFPQAKVTNLLEDC